MANGGERKFATERTQRFRLCELSRIDESTISNIEEFGCSVIQVHPLACAPPEEQAWSYTIGIFDTCGRPELITVGLNESTAKHLLNAATRLLRDGVDLTKGRHKGLLGRVDCEFRAVDPKWIPHVMGWARWFYDGTEFPILQAAYPDLENRFPGEAGFNDSFQQPLLQKDSAFGNLERSLWEGGVDHKIGWKFPDNPQKGSSSPRQLPIVKSRSPTFRMMLMMGLGSFFVTAWQVTMDLCCDVFIRWWNLSPF